VNPAYIGFCVDDHACDALATSNQCAAVVGDGGVALASCTPTNDVHPYGVCGPAGSAQTGAICDAARLCAPGAVCIYEPGASTGTCLAFCGLGTNAGHLPCAPGQFCEPVMFGADPTPDFDGGAPNVPNDDPYALDWGACAPVPDGGVPDAP
jgi:hypothetical protein